MILRLFFPKGTETNMARFIAPKYILLLLSSCYIVWTKELYIIIEHHFSNLLKLYETKHFIVLEIFWGVLRSIRYYENVRTIFHPHHKFKAS